MTTPAPDDITSILAAHRDLEGPLLPILHAMQAAFGYIPEAAHRPIAEALNISRAELHGVISFYHDFRANPAGRHVLKICRAEACQAVGGAVLAEATLAKLGLAWHGTTANGAVTVEPVYCLGLCACAPAAMLDDRVVGRVDAARIDALLAEAGA
ncbi:ATP synthase subunit E [Roseovarius sp. EC-HK134]|jgi:formate dehydrogenase subunit gamma|uniref:NADP-reducing hydrogenase subunit HndA n=2 Tax=Roseovarius mucosus TaxID=215743 RepID=A0A1V0RUC9_9RHOB|nr:MULTISPECIES: formate dehydrogenase subunit gamma [Roseovarius]ARE85391.1 NADP-reducing hydrogenase subunit HndA [Roseovarius mucosus]AWZ21485.1 NAD-dependent formate dehydrogenase gamma subunit [Roseovarius sp. AK1035]EDM30975.1 ATP synthase subunit E [Roseovarius sp. TM1035]MBW4974959.1 formate dehydrogenase subunit gamma [Roseovarius mucosus]VVT27975.1 ATP synthase subunit E [Roseovarius sp. EC-SD190]|tara:strand:+ start:1140 stop:1604 length:465 start_codon:yes stop_codon:yes gene_type:complete